MIPKIGEIYESNDPRDHKRRVCVIGLAYSNERAIVRNTKTARDTEIRFKAFNQNSVRGWTHVDYLE